MLVNRVQGSCQHFLSLLQRRKTRKDQWEWKSRGKEENVSYSSIRGSQHSFNVSDVQKTKQKTDILFVTNSSELSIRLTQTLARWRNHIPTSCLTSQAWADQDTWGTRPLPSPYLSTARSVVHLQEQKGQKLSWKCSQLHLWFHCTIRFS